jgi:hypothetical protein
MAGTSLVVAQSDKFVFGGYLDWTFTHNNGNTPPSTFNSSHFNPIFLYQLEDNLLASAEVEIETGGDEFILEYGQIDYLANDYLTFTVGKFLVPFGVFNRRLHPTWISRVPGMPLSNDMVVPTDWSETGLMVSGAAGFGGRGGRINYAAYVVNGLEGSSGADIRDLRKEKDPRDIYNSNKAVGGRLGMVPAAGVEFGFSGYTSKYDINATPLLNLNMFGADAEYHYQDLFELRGEFNQADQQIQPDTLNSTDLPYLRKRGYYVQAALRLAITDKDLLMPIELALRFSGQDFPDKENDYHEVTPCINYSLGSTAFLRLAYSFYGGSKTDMPTNQFTALITKAF